MTRAGAETIVHDMERLVKEVRHKVSQEEGLPEHDCEVMRGNFPIAVS